MTDRELLELAAKAAGIELDYTIRPDGKAFYHSGSNALALADGGWFEPLSDDGDAFRLMAKLGLCVEFGFDDGEWKVSAGTLLSALAIENVTGYPHEEVRKCIVRAAAEIGKTK